MTSWTHQFNAILTAPSQQVFAALTDPAELRLWFADEVEFEPNAGGAFRFWGRRVYGAATCQDARGVLTHIKEDRLLGFTWDLHGVAGEVRLELSPASTDRPEPATRLAGSHRFAAELPISRGRELVDDLWRFHCGNLAAHLAGGSGIVRPDFSDPSPEVRLSVVIDAPRERVFAALLDPSILNQWIASEARVESRIGGTYSFGWKYSVEGREVAGGPTRILDLVEGEKLVMDWPDWRGDASVPPQTVTWLLRSIGSRTEVTLVHSGFVRAADLSDYPFGWRGFLAELNRVLSVSDGTEALQQGS